MFIHVQFETFFFTFLSFFIFSYLLRYISTFLNSTVENSSINLNQKSTYESGSPIFYKAKFEFHLQSYLLAIFFLLFELELFLTYPFLVYISNVSSKNIISVYNWDFINYEANRFGFYDGQQGIHFLLLEEYRIIVLTFSLFFFLNLIFLFAFEWSYKGLNFNKNLYGKYKRNSTI